MANKKYEYEGRKAVTSIRLSGFERRKIFKRFSTIQAFIQHSIKMLDQDKNDGKQ